MVSAGVAWLDLTSFERYVWFSLVGPVEAGSVVRRGHRRTSPSRPEDGGTGTRRTRAEAPAARAPRPPERSAGFVDADQVARGVADGAVANVTVEGRRGVRIVARKAACMVMSMAITLGAARGPALLDS